MELAFSWRPRARLATCPVRSYSLGSVIRGAHDAYITRWAHGAKAHGGPIFVRFAHEMNDRHYPGRS